MGLVGTLVDLARPVVLGAVGQPPQTPNIVVVAARLVRVVKPAKAAHVHVLPARLCATTSAPTFNLTPTTVVVVANNAKPAKFASAGAVWFCANQVKRIARESAMTPKPATYTAVVAATIVGRTLLVLEACAAIQA